MLEQGAYALMHNEDLVGKTVVIEAADDNMLKLRELGSLAAVIYYVGANGLYVSEALSA